VVILELLAYITSLRGGHVGDFVRGAGTEYIVDVVLQPLVFEEAKTAP
jgi:hypothetical protein